MVAGLTSFGSAALQGWNAASQSQTEFRREQQREIYAEFIAESSSLRQTNSAYLESLRKAFNELAAGNAAGVARAVSQDFTYVTGLGEFRSVLAEVQLLSLQDTRAAADEVSSAHDDCFQAVNELRELLNDALRTIDLGSVPQEVVNLNDFVRLSNAMFAAASDVVSKDSAFIQTARVDLGTVE